MKYAILIGIDYHNLSLFNKLHSIDKDILSMFRLSTGRFGIPVENILVITDTKLKKLECKTIKLDYPDADVIVSEVSNFLDNASRESVCSSTLITDEVLIYISCHGTLVRNRVIENAIVFSNKNKTKENITAYTLFNMIFGQGIYSSRDECNGINIIRTPLSVDLFVIIDSCHSGNMIDLPYVYSNEGFSENNENGIVTYPLVICISACDKSTVTLSCVEGSPFTHYIVSMLNNLDGKVTLQILRNKIYDVNYFTDIKPVISTTRDNERILIPFVSETKKRNISI